MAACEAVRRPQAKQAIKGNQGNINMPNITVVVWNIQTFGDRSAARRGSDYTELCAFIAKVLTQVSADVFLMMELRSGGAPYLPTLKAALGNGWEYDYIPGSIIEGVNGIPALPNQLGFTQAGHSEGYAVFWRDDVNKFAMIPAARQGLSRHPTNGDSYINLIFEGRSPAVVNPNTQVLTAPNFNPNGNNQAIWGELGFPQNSPIVELDPLRWDKVRRPCYCLLNLVIANAQAVDRLLPILVYHAPSLSGKRVPGTFAGVQASALSRQLYEVDDTTQQQQTLVNINQAAIAGDFNLNREGPDQQVLIAYEAYTDDFDANNNDEGGAQLPDIWVNDANTAANNLTAVRLNRSNGNMITSLNTNDYRWLAIDNLFYRGLNAVAPVQGEAYNVLDDLIGNVFLNQFGGLVDTNAKRTVIHNFKELLDAEESEYRYTNAAGTPCMSRKRQGNQFAYYGPILADIQNYNNYTADLTNGFFTNARRAAEFYVNSISDHLPLVFRFQV